MRASLIFVILCASAIADQEWRNAVEEVLAHITLGPLKMDFTPQYVGNRTMEFVLRTQTNRFRALVASAIVGSSTTEAIVCVPRAIERSAVKAVLDELKERTFEAFWIHEMDECLQQSGVLVKFPAPKK